jgi:hypothetical protein
MVRLTGIKGVPTEMSISSRRVGGITGVRTKLQHIMIVATVRRRGVLPMTKSEVPRHPMEVTTRLTSATVKTEI